MRWFGDPVRFALAVGDWHERNKTLRVFDVWVGGERTSSEDNLAYVPQMRRALVFEATKLAEEVVPVEPIPEDCFAEQHRRLEALDDGSAEKFWFMHWGPTTDHLFTFGFRVGSDFVVTCRRVDRPDGNILEARIEHGELMRVLMDASVALSDF